MSARETFIHCLYFWFLMLGGLFNACFAIQVNSWLVQLFAIVSFEYLAWLHPQNVITETSRVCHIPEVRGGHFIILYNKF